MRVDIHRYNKKYCSLLDLDYPLGYQFGIKKPVN